MPKTEKSPRTKNINIRVSAEEREKIEQLAAAEGLSVSDWVRQKIDLATERKPKPEWARKCPGEKIVRHVRAADPELVRHLGLIGNNLNQLAMWANRHKSAIDAAKIVRGLAALEEQMRAISDAHQVH